MSDLHSNISLFIENQFSSYMNEEGPLLVQFIKYYYEWMGQENNPYGQLNKIKDYRTSDITNEQMLDFLKNEFMRAIPKDISVDDRFLIKNIADFYKAKGSEKAYKLLFRILYNEDVDFYYPGKDILRVSAGKWIVEKSMGIEPYVTTAEIKNAILIKGRTSRSRATFSRYDDSKKFLYVINDFGDFQNGELIFDEASNNDIGMVTTNGITKHPGKYTTTDGFLSADKYLQDGIYYQEYSYVVISSKFASEYETIAKKLVHPSGTKFFGRTAIHADLDGPITNDQITISVGYDFSGEYFPINIELSYPIQYSPITIDTIFTLDINISTPATNINTYLYFKQFGGYLTLSSNNTIDYYKNFTIEDMLHVPGAYIGTSRLFEYSNANNLLTLLGSGTSIIEIHNTVPGGNVLTNDNYVPLLLNDSLVVDTQDGDVLLIDAELALPRTNRFLTIAENYPNGDFVHQPFYYFSDETEYDQGGIDIPDGKKAITINDDILTIDDDIVIL
jgi:hypothetical protein